MLDRDTSRFRWDGICRGLVIDSVDPKMRMRVKLWIPDVMAELEKSKGLWASPGNNAIGGRNYSSDVGEDMGTEHYYQGSCMIPQKGSWVYLFFEQGNPNEPRYLSACDTERTKAPIENQQGQIDKKWTIIKTHSGRTIITSDDSFDERTEITGKKRNLSGDDPSGNKDSVYTIDGNQTVIVIDERNGKEKILIRDYKGNFINLDTENENLDINIHNNMNLKVGGNLKIQVEGTADILVKDNMNMTTNKELHITGKSTIREYTSGNHDFISGGQTNIKATGTIDMDSSLVQSQMGAANDSLTALVATEASPIGNRGHDGDGLDTTTGDEDEAPKSITNTPATIKP